MGKKDKYGYKHDDGHYSKITGNDTNSSFSVYDKNPSKKGHSAIHININTETGKGSIVEHGADGKSTKTDTSCYLTTACMKYYQENFDDHCYELTILRWFRDNFVCKEDIEHYYEIAPIIIQNINDMDKPNVIYDYIYHNIVDYCVKQIELGNYDKAYSRYKNSVLSLEQQLVRPLLQQRLVRVLKRTLL